MARSGGGQANVITPNSVNLEGRSVISGGYSNTINADYSSIGGGRANTVNGDFSGVGSGYGNSANTNAVYSCISGGLGNSSLAPYSAIGGGRYNSCAGTLSVCVGGGTSANVNIFPGAIGNVA